MFKKKINFQGQRQLVKWCATGNAWRTVNWQSGLNVDPPWRC